MVILTNKFKIKITRENVHTEQQQDLQIIEDNIQSLIIKQVGINCNAS